MRLHGLRKTEHQGDDIAKSYSPSMIMKLKRYSFAFQESVQTTS